jgi:hypothetical protein
VRRLQDQPDGTQGSRPATAASATSNGTNAVRTGLNAVQGQLKSTMDNMQWVARHAC